MIRALTDKIPVGIFCLLFVICCIIVSWACLFFFNKIFRQELLKKIRDASGIIFGAVSLVYSLIAAFVIIAVWQDYEELNTGIQNESDKLYAISFQAAELPDSSRHAIQTFIKQYAQLAVKKSWLQNLKAERGDQYAVLSLKHALLKINLPQASQQTTINTIQDELTDLGDYRRERLNHATSHVPGLVWMVLVAESIITIISSYFLFVDSKRLQYLFTAVLTAMIAMSMFLIFMLDHPFMGSSRVSPEPFKQFYNIERK